MGFRASLPNRGFSWNSSHKVPHRAVKYIGSQPYRDPFKMFPPVWARLREVSEGLPFSLVANLHAEMTAIIEETDRLLDFLQEADPEKRSRDQHVVDSQAWRIAFTDEGKSFASANSCPEETVCEYVQWLSDNYKFEFQKDPIPAWKKRLAAFEKENNHHMALKKYQEFVNQTAFVREAVEASAAALDEEIQRQIDAARGK